MGSFTWGPLQAGGGQLLQSAAASITAVVTPGTIAAPTLSCAVAVVARPGATLTALQAGSLSYKWVAAIHGYPYLLSDATGSQAVSAWTGGDWSAQLSELYVHLQNEQRLNPWDPFPEGGHLTLQVAPDSADTFGVDLHTSDDGEESFQTATIDNNDTTVNIKSSSGFASSGDACIGTETIAYTGTTGTSLTGVTRGKYAPFGTTAAIASRFGSQHRVTLDSQGFQNLPLVTEQHRVWPDRWVGLWMHRYDHTNGLLNTRDNALLCFAGRVVETRDNPQTMTTDVECEHVLDVVKNAVLGQDMWSAKMKEGINLVPGWQFLLADNDGTTTRTGERLRVVTSGAAGAYQINSGVYSHGQLYDALNTWAAYLIDTDADLAGRYKLALVGTPDGTRLQLSVDLNGNTGWFSFHYPAALHEAFGEFPDDGGGIGNDLRGFKVHDVVDTEVFIGAKAPLRNNIVVSTAAGPSRLLVTEEVGTFVDQGIFIPGANPLELVSQSEVTGYVLADGHLCFICRYDDSPTPLLDKIVFYHPLNSPQETSFFNNIKITVDDPRGPIELKQIFVIEDTVADIIKQIFYSTGTAGYNHATWDTLPYSLGLSIPGALLGDNFINSCDVLPGANVPIALIIDKPKPLVEIIGGDLKLRFAFLRWAEEGLQFWSWKTPITGAVLNESNKAHPSGTEDEERCTTKLTSDWTRNLIRIEYNRDFTASNNSGYRDSIQIVDRVAIDDAARKIRQELIRAPNTYTEHTAQGAGIEDLTERFKQVGGMFTRQIRRITRTVAPTLWEGAGYAIGDTVLFSDEFARDPDLGTRGITSRPAIIVAHSYNPGGSQPGAEEPADMHGEVELMLLELQRYGEYVPTAQVDDTAANSGYIDGTKTLTCYAHKHSESYHAADASYFTAGRKVRIVEIDPADPAAPASWDRVVDTQTGNTIVLTVALSSPAWDTAKRYRVIWDDYPDTIGNQQTFSYQADDADGKIADSRVPFQYAVGFPALTITAYTANSAADPVELMPTSSYGDGVGLDVGTQAAVARLINNMLDYKTAVSTPYLQNTELSGAAATGTWLLVLVLPISLTQEILTTTVNRVLSVAPHFKSSDGASASVRITLARQFPAPDSVNDIDRGVVIEDVTFTTTSTTYATPAAQDIPIGNLKRADGTAYLLVELTLKARCMGVAKAQEGPRT